MLSLYVDSAARDDVEPLLEVGIFRGITTNPTILDRAGLSGKDIPDVYQWAVAAGAQEVFLQTWGDTADELEKRGRDLAELGDRAAREQRRRICHPRDAVGTAREVERRRRQLAHVHAVAAHGLDAGEQAERQRGSGGAIVASYGEPGRAPQALPAERRDRLPDGARALRRELIAHGAADVVLAKDGGGELHGGPGVTDRST